jgi:hypothetical protein
MGYESSVVSRIEIITTIRKTRCSGFLLLWKRQSLADFICAAEASWNQMIQLIAPMYPIRDVIELEDIESDVFILLADTLDEIVQRRPDGR